MSGNDKSKERVVDSLKRAISQDPQDLQTKKYLAQELHRVGQWSEAYPLCLEILEQDLDLEIQRILHVIEKSIPPAELSDGRGQAERVLQSLREAKRDSIDFSDVAGMVKVKEAIRMNILYPLQHPELAAAYGIQAGGGMLLFGPPGCGKTYIARAVAGEINANFIPCSLHELLGSYFGQSNRNLHNFFHTARNSAPSVLFFDEIDAVAGKRSDLNGPMRTLVNQFLTEMDGIGGRNKNVLIIAATNRPWDIDDALRRPGRFNSMLFVSPPDLQARAQIFRSNLVGIPCAEDIDYLELAALAKRFSAADVKHVCVLAQEHAFRSAMVSGQPVPVSQSLLLTCLQEVRPSTLTWLDTAKSYVAHSNASGKYNDIKTYLEAID